MSYILEALKKADHKRHREAVPGLQSVHESGAAGQRRKRSPWPWIFFVVLVINAVFLLSFFSKDIFLTAEDPSPEPQGLSSGIEKNVGAEIPSSPVSIATEPTDAISEPLAKVTAPILSDSTDYQNPTQDSPGQALEGNIVTLQESKDTDAVPSPVVLATDVEPADISQESMPPDTSASGLATEIVYPPLDSERIDIGDAVATQNPEQINSSRKPTSIPLLENLPGALRQDIPELTISFHVFTKKLTGRLVSINGRVMREGQSVAEDLTLEEITSEGVVLNYMGNRFRVAVF
jgi:general secretion pathway protein B